ncbi:MAG: C4-dicarboxylate TRAP transporter substrate-binding protein [Gammaproteobacteria bacterium]|nr:C4-dicarboxylate TRAP transporter substrate-binding protein [Gammaproteobacteria bacterium]
MLQYLRWIVIFLVVLLQLPLSTNAVADLYTLRIGSGHPAGPTVYAGVLRDYLVPELKRRVSAETEHELRIIEGYGGSIASVSETLEAVQVGILDIGGFCTCFEPAKMFLHNFQYFVPFGPEGAEEGIKAARRVYDAYPWLNEHLETNYGQSLIAINGWDNYHLGSSVPWEAVEDLQGVKIAGAGPNLPWLELAGVIPVQSILPDAYMAMQTGVYSGWLMFPSAYFAYKLHEPAPYYTLIGFGAMGGAIIITMNTRSLERLPSEVRDIVIEVGRSYENEAAKILDNRQKSGLENLRNSGATVRELPNEVRAQWARSLSNFPNEMAKEADSRGMPGSEIVRAYIETITQSGYDWPVEYVIN